MAYPISATKLQSYHRCPFAYYLKYELKLHSSEFFGSAALGTALHQALAQYHRDWHYHLDPLPDTNWLYRCWEEQSGGLSDAQIAEGRRILEGYYHNFIANRGALKRPLAVEGKIQAVLRVENLEFSISGRYDRLDVLKDGLELIDYKSTKEVRVPDPEDMGLQIGLYYLALEQTYRQSLRYMSLLFLRSGEKVQFKASAKDKKRVQQVIGNLATQLRHDRRWEPTPGDQCDRCTYARYCPVVTAQPAPLPAKRTPTQQLQLTLSL